MPPRFEASLLDDVLRIPGQRRDVRSATPLEPLGPALPSAPPGCSDRRALAMSFLGLPAAPVLGAPKIMLDYQSDDVYKTDVAAHIPTLGYMFACKTPDDEGQGEVSKLHPSIVFNDIVQNIHVRGKDTTTGTTFWNAKYVLPPAYLWGVVGKSSLDNPMIPLKGGFFKMPCVRKDDPTTHHFDISIQSQDGYYSDHKTPWGKKEGFENFKGPRAHIGFHVKRFPQLEAADPVNPAKPQREVRGQWARGGNVSTGGVHDDRHDRVLRGEENPFEDPVTGAPGTNYYHYIADPEAKKRNLYEYYDKYGPPVLLGPLLSKSGSESSPLGNAMGGLL